MKYIWCLKIWISAEFAVPIRCYYCWPSFFFLFAYSIFLAFNFYSAIIEKFSFHSIFRRNSIAHKQQKCMESDMTESTTPTKNRKKTADKKNWNDVFESKEKLCNGIRATVVNELYKVESNYIRHGLELRCVPWPRTKNSSSDRKAQQRQKNILTILDDVLREPQEFFKFHFISDRWIKLFSQPIYLHGVYRCTETPKIKVCWTHGFIVFDGRVKSFSFFLL